MAIALSAAGCFSEPQAYPNGALLCSRSGNECPDGYLCGADQRCWAVGTSADGGLGPCTEGERRCDGGQPQRCDAANRWVNEPACTAAFPMCSAGHCVSGCTLGQTRCTPGGTSIETCDATGMWQSTMQCTFACAGGSCTGACTPGAKRCGADGTPETCDQTGTWKRASAPCPFVCSGNGDCTGECDPGTARCATATTLQSCGGNGTWATPAMCPYVCDGATARCTGECTPGAKRCSGLAAQTCDAAGRWVTTQTCNPVCSNGVCAPCRNGDRQCNQNRPQQCISDNWVYTTTAPCPYVCDPAVGCTGECVPGTQVCVGNTARSCGANGRYTDTVCPNVCMTATGTCGGVCAPGARRCSGGIAQLCSSAGQWTDTGPACTFGCNAATGMCQACTPNPDSVTCTNRCAATVNNCGQTVQCANTCVAPQSCGGGGTAGVCGCTPATMCPAGKNCGTMPDGCGGMVRCGPDTCTGAGQTCGGGAAGPNVCGCTQSPNICMNRCGTITDNCGAPVNCAAPCPTGTTCGGGPNPMPTVCG